MAANLLFKMLLVGTPSAEWCSKKSFTHKGDSRVYNKLSGKMVVLLSELFNQPAIVKQ
jgi:hypothetical protein